MSRSVDYTADQDGAAAAPGSSRTHAMVWVGYLATGTALGILFMKSEVLTWYRMQEMFRFQSIHMFGIIGVAILVAMVSQLLLTRVQARTMTGEPIHVSPKVATPAGTRYSSRPHHRAQRYGCLVDSGGAAGRPHHIAEYSTTKHAFRCRNP
jgi:hypothetical protein